MPQTYTEILVARHSAEKLIAGLRFVWLVTMIALTFSRRVVGQSLDQTKADLESAANNIKVLEPLTIGNYRTEPQGGSASSQSVEARLATSNYAPAFLTALLSDSSPRIRTLALELLFRRQDPQFLPRIFEHATDEEASFEHVVFYNFRANGPPDSKRERQTVASFAKAMLGFYGVRGDFWDFWAARKDRRYWFGWLRSRLITLGGQSSPNPGLMQRLVPLRNVIDGFLEPDRNVYLIWLQTEYNEPALATDSEIVEAVRRLGRENVLRIVEGNPPGGDPDLQPSWEPGKYRLKVAIILKHSKGILQPSDADRVAAVVQRERARVKQHPIPETFVSPSYVIIQAELSPDKASEILHREIDFQSGEWNGGPRGQLAAALLRIRGKQEQVWLHDFFYGEPVSRIGPQAQLALIGSLEPQDRQKMEELLDDPRLRQLGTWIITAAYQRFQGLPDRLLIEWFYSHDHRKEQGTVYSAGYFLRVIGREDFLRNVLRDPRLSSLPLGVLHELQQELVTRYRLPKPFLDSFPHLDRFGNPLGEQGLSELISFLQEGAKYLSKEYRRSN